MRAWWSQLLLPHRLTHLRNRYDCSLLCFDEPTMKIESGPLCFLRSSILALISCSAKMLDLRKQSGPDSIFIVGSSKHNNEQSYLLRKWVSLWGCLLYTSPSPRDGLLY